MPTKLPPEPEQTPPHRGPADAVERLYVYWIVTAAFALFATVVIAAFLLSTRSTLTRQVDQFNQMAERLAGLERSVSALQAGQQELAARLTAARETPPAAPAEPAAPAPQPTSRPATTGTPSDAQLNAQLDQTLPAGADLPRQVADAQTAAELIQQALPQVGRATWRGATWARLAVLARLLDQDQAADQFARQAFSAGETLLVYAELSARRLLAAGRPADAFPHAQHLVERTGGSPAARLLLARALLALGDAAAADELLPSSAEIAKLSEPDRLALARTCLGLYRWDGLSAAVAAVTAAPDDLAREFNFLRAVSLIQQTEGLAEAKAILDYLAAAGVEQSWPLTGPEAYEIATWRGVALLRGRQVQSARQALLEAAQLRPDRPEAQYWLGMLELSAARNDAAKAALQQALATSAGFAPAWEALASLELNSGNLETALENIRQALAANERRAPAHFLLALAHAKVADREAAAAALQAAFQLEPGYLEEAKQAELFQQLFTSAELEALATATTPESSPPAEDQPPTP